MNKLILSLGIALWAVNAQAQVVSIPDANFKAALLNYNPKIDLNNNGEIEVNEAIAIKKMNVSIKSISSLTGIESFTSLDSLDCYGNQISILDLSSNTSLSYLVCSSNNLTSLNVTKNTALISLYCKQNQLTILDVSKNISLATLWCYSNKLLKIDVSLNTALVDLECDDNQLSSLDVSKNTTLDYLYCGSNPTLSQICVNNTQLNKTISTPDNWSKDATATWSTTCVTGIEDDLLQPANKKLVRILSPLGQELKPEQASEGFYIYQYSDGSTRKVMKQ